MYIYTTNLTLCVYTVHIQCKNITLLFIAHCFCERVAFIFDIAAFDFSGSLRTDDSNGNWWTNLTWNVPGFRRVEREKKQKNKQRRGVHQELSPIYKHNFVTFFCQMTFVWFLQPNLFLFIHSTLRVKIIPRSLKRTKNILAVNLCKEIVAIKGKKKTSLKEKTRYTACECYLQSVHLFKKQKQAKKKHKIKLSTLRVCARGGKKSSLQAKCESSSVFIICLVLPKRWLQ